MTEPVPINRQGLSAAATSRLRDMIIEGVLVPGTRLNERVLCEQLGISRTPLREAFKTLAVEGLIDLLPNRGAVVAEMSTADIEQTFEVMGALEGLSGQLACQRITAEELAEIRALHFEMLAAHARRDLSAYYRVNLAIHARINAAAANAVLTETYKQINARIQSLRFRSNFNQEKWDAAVKEHDAMLAALEKRDGEALRQLLHQHLLKKCATVIDELNSRKTA
ncbi:transcriptional regulator, GntR family [Noviherbaspirillum humi]|uniref:Transcriptional regulator, GntR family n=1 Tax=Noviherbaspirillum humi TaxID=1688639 RepID=A0A239LGX9_9BURK|nr:GntR family transcriptional regulator [Noviherbaspirillum humi]SNT29917.1 transcriptional regulator, GntR family [Noviherbaspirillum humi]